jgi:hypothetical protein
MAGNTNALKKLRTLRLIRMTPNESRGDSEGQVKSDDCVITRARRIQHADHGKIGRRAKARQK